MRQHCRKWKNVGINDSFLTDHFRRSYGALFEPSVSHIIFSNWLNRWLPNGYPNIWLCGWFSQMLLWCHVTRTWLCKRAEYLCIQICLLIGYSNLIRLSVKYKFRYSNKIKKYIKFIYFIKYSNFSIWLLNFKYHQSIFSILDYNPYISIFHIFILIKIQKLLHKTIIL